MMKHAIIGLALGCGLALLGGTMTVKAADVGDPNAKVGGHLTVPSGNLGVGTDTPAQRFHIKDGRMRFQGIAGNPSSYWEFLHNANDSGDYGLSILRNNVAHFNISNTGAFTVNDIQYAGGMMRFGKAADYVNEIAGTNFLQLSGGSDLLLRAGASERMRVKGATGFVGIGTASPATMLDVKGEISCNVVNIRGAADLSERFDVSPAAQEAKIVPGTVVCIDKQNPGKLVVSAKAYDKTVAGIISGAGEIKSGVLLGQAGTIADGKYAVALTGRVYCMVDATKSPIEPGDMLTTSNTPGHAMKAGNARLAQGAIIGKAMTGLKEGKGLVLVLVNLQ